MYLVTQVLNKFHHLFLGFLFFGLFGKSIVFAQEAVPPRFEDRLEFDFDENIPFLEDIDPLSLPSGTEQLGFKGPEKVYIQSINVTGVTLFPLETIEELIKPYENQETLVLDLSEIEQAFAELYEDQGYSGSGAIITPESKFDKRDRGNLHLQAIELKTSELKISGAGRLKPFVKDRLQGLVDKPLNVDKISNRLRFLLDDPRVDTLDAVIIPRVQIDQKELVIDIKPANPINVSVLLNNARSPAVGSLERGFSLNHLNVFGLGDTFSLDFRNTDGSNIVGAGYSVPITPKGGELFFDYLYGQSKIIEEPFEPFNLRSKTQIFSLGFLEPILQRSTNSMIQELSLGVKFKRTENEDTLDGFQFPLSESANDFGRTRSTSLSFLQNYTHRSSENTLKLSSEFSLGLGIGATNNDAFGDGSFVKWLGEGLFAKRFNDRWVFVSKTSVQLSNRDLIGNEQYALGGQGSVRGIRKNKIARNNGFSAQQEIRFKVFEDLKQNHRIDLSSFFDFGYGWNASNQLNEPNESPASFGFGLTYIFQNNLFATIEYALHILGKDKVNNSLQEEGITFSMQWRF